jgi:hypothetical protein
MEGIFGILTVSKWLAILRIGVGLWWLKSFLHKTHREFVNGHMANWTLALAGNNTSETYGKLIKRLVEPNKCWFPYLTFSSPGFDLWLPDTLGSDWSSVYEPELPLVSRGKTDQGQIRSIPATSVNRVKTLI